MRNDYVLVVAGNGWANEVVVNVRIVVNRAGAQGDGEQRACKSDLYVCASGLPPPVIPTRIIIQRQAEEEDHHADAMANARSSVPSTDDAPANQRKADEDEGDDCCGAHRGCARI